MGKGTISQVSVVLFLDLSAAFDVVDHNTLRDTLEESRGITGQCLSSGLTPTSTQGKEAQSLQLEIVDDKFSLSIISVLQGSIFQMDQHSMAVQMTMLSNIRSLQIFRMMKKQSSSKVMECHCQSSVDAHRQAEIEPQQNSLLAKGLNYSLWIKVIRVCHKPAVKYLGVLLLLVSKSFVKVGGGLQERKKMLKKQRP